MISIDLRTVVGMAAFSMLLLTLTTYAAHHGMRRQVHGLLHWANGGMALFCAALLLAGRGVLPAWLSIVVANGLFFLSMSLWSAGTLRFLRRSVPWRGMLATASSSTALLGWFTFAQDDYRVRLVVVAVTGGALMAMQIPALMRHGDGKVLTRIFIGALCLQVLVFALRAVTAALSISTGGELFASSSMQTLYLGLTQFFALVLMLGFFLLAALRLQDQLEQLARRDALTQLLNRRAFFEAMDVEFSRARRSGRDLSMLVFDLDHFKRLNDSLGIEAGDAALLRVAELVGAHLRAGDAFGRIGGEEFAVLLPETAAATAIGLAERLRTALEGSLRSLAQPLTASLGVSTLQAGDTDARQLMRRADGALHAAKAAGRNRTIQA